MKEEEVVRWLKSQGAIPTPQEMLGRLQKAGHHGLPTAAPPHHPVPACCFANWVAWSN